MSETLFRVHYSNPTAQNSTLVGAPALLYEYMKNEQNQLDYKVFWALSSLWLYCLYVWQWPKNMFV